jgi:hypothetical protein
MERDLRKLTLDRMLEVGVVYFYERDIDYDKIMEWYEDTSIDTDIDLEELDAMIDSSNRVLTVSSFKEWLVAAGLGVLTGGLTDVIRVVYRAATGDDRKKFREACMDLRAEVKAAKVK